MNLENRSKNNSSQEPSRDHLRLELTYTETGDRYEVKSEMTKQGQIELIEAFLSSQIGAGEDNTPANKQKQYRIKLDWYLQNDEIEVTSNTGNKGLRNGILMCYLKRLYK